MRLTDPPTMPHGGALLAGAFAAAVRPRKHLTVSQWADAHRVLSAKSSSEPLPWRTERTPYLREVLDCLSVRSPVKRVVLKFATQRGKTEVGLNWLGYIIDHAPAPTLVVVPTIQVRRRWVIQRLNPLLRDTPRLAAVIDALSSRTAAHAEDIKDFPGGLLVLGGANSPASLGSMPIQNVICDELDDFPWDVGGRGDPLGLIRQRQSNFPRRKLLLLSTPTLADASQIEDEWLASDMRRYWVPCPHCAERQVLEWANLRWGHDLAWVSYVCTHCGAAIEEHHKRALLAEGEWRPEHPERSREERGYHLNQLYSPIGLGFTWKEIAAEWLRCHKDPAKLKRFVNTALAEVWQDRTAPKAHELAERAGRYPVRTVPPGALLLTAGVDTQDDRLHGLLCGWGRGPTCAVVDRVELPGDPGRSPVLLDGLLPLCEALRVRLDTLARAGALKVGEDAGLWAQVSAGLEAHLTATGRDLAAAARAGGLAAGDLAAFLRTGEPWREDVWASLYAWLASPVRNAHGQAMRTAAIAIDSGGHHTQDVYAFARAAPLRRLMATKGASTPGKPVIAGRPSAVDLTRRGRIHKAGAKVWMVGADTAKHVLANWLAGDGAAEPEQRRVRFAADLPDEFYAQITSEVFDPERRKWVLRRGHRNEDLDCWVGAYVAAHHPEVRIDRLRAADWDALAATLEPDAPAAPPPDAPEAPAQPAPAPPRTPRNKRGNKRGRGRGFVTRW